MNYLALLFLGLTLPLTGWSQKDLPEMAIKKETVQGHIEYLASDALMGRRTGSPGNDTAAAYLVKQYQAFGVKPLPGQDDYYQPIRFDLVTPPSASTLKIGDLNLQFKEDYILLSGKAVDATYEVVFAEYGWIDEEAGINNYQDLDVKGKVIITLPGIPDSKDPFAPIKAIRKKRNMAKAQGAAALLELYQVSFPWPMFKNNFVKERLSIGDDGKERNELPYGFINAPMGETLETLKKGRIVNAAFSSSGEAVQSAYSNNVAGMIEGTDEELKKQFVLITAHYDHIGAGKEGGGLYTPQDSIFNGARDNAMGTAALLSAAQAIGQQPTKRSVLFLAVTAEEIGLLGSEYYAEHPLLPLKQMVFNLNTDGAGYDDVTAISVIGYGRTGTDAHFEAAAKMVGLKVVQNPAPEAGLFDRSDNVSFSKVGIPSATLSPGITGFSQEIMSRYHQITDEAATLDFDYVLKYCQSFAHTARLIGDAAEAPQWMEGDKYEEVGKKLYGSKE